MPDGALPLSDLVSDVRDSAPPENLDRTTARWATIGSILLHVAVALLLLYRVSTEERAVPPFVPVELVQPEEGSPGSQTRNGSFAAPERSPSPPRREASLAPLRPSRPRAAPPVAANPTEKAHPTDPLQAQLEALSQLRLPNAPEGGSPGASSGAGRGRGGAYRLRDYVRSQVEKRWNLDLDALGDRTIVVSIHVVLGPDGHVAAAEIVDQKRYLSDATYHALARSARNAVLLSSPIALPPGLTKGSLDMVLSMNPRDALR